MAVTVKIIRVFVGSPGELSEERARLEEVIRELNLLWGGILGLHLELVKWETHAYPGIGSEPQAVIDEEIGDKYDIFLGMLWAKFGTPTGDAGSGTEHEFRRAYLRYKQDPNQLKIMFYFKDGPLAPSQINAEQLSKVEEFKKQLGELGSLYWVYKTTDEFVNLARIHLTKQLQNWGPKPATKGLAAQAPRPVEAAAESGFLDLLESVETGYQKMTLAIEKMGKAVQVLGEKMAQRTAEINQGHAMDQSSRIRYWKKVADSLAEDMQAFCTETEAEIPIFGKSYRESTDALARAASMAQEFGGNQRQQLEALSAQMNSLRLRVGQVRPLVQGFRDSIRKTPRVTTAYAAAQNRTVAVLDSLDVEYEGVEQHTAELVNGLEALIRRAS